MAETLIEVTAEAGLEMVLPGGIPTHIHNVLKKWTRLDQVYISDHSTDLVNTCDMVTEQRGINTDHLPILTKLDLATLTVEESAIHNFREVNWELFKKGLERRLGRLERAGKIHSQVHLNKACCELTKAIQEMITETVPVMHICTRSKRWWTKELTQLRRNTNRLGRQSSKLSKYPYHMKHAEHVDAVKLYRNTLETTKQQHWRDWLERVEEPDIWTAHKLTSLQPTDGGKSRIPVLTCKSGNTERKAVTNEEKGRARSGPYHQGANKKAAPQNQAIQGPWARRYPEHCAYQVC